MSYLIVNILFLSAIFFVNDSNKPLYSSLDVSLQHSGGLNSEGCHNDRKNGGYHCHGRP